MGFLIGSFDLASISANGQTGPLPTDQVSGATVMVTVDGASGTTPTLTMFFEVGDGNGHWYPVSPSPSLFGTNFTGAGTAAGGAVGVGYGLTEHARIRWTVGGTTPVFTGVHIRVYGNS